MDTIEYKGYKINIEQESDPLNPREEDFDCNIGTLVAFHKRYDLGDKTHLSDVISEKWTPLPKMKVKCIVDVEISYQDAQELREAMIDVYKLRDFILEEDRETKQGVLEGENVKVSESMLDFTGIDDLVTQQLEILKTDPNIKVDPDLLISIYKDLPIETVEGDEQ